jgi:hypothetical protein
MNEYVSQLQVFIENPLPRLFYSPMLRLVQFEKEFQGLFGPLDLSPAMGVVSRASLGPVCAPSMSLPSQRVPLAELSSGEGVSSAAQAPSNFDDPSITPSPRASSAAAAPILDEASQRPPPSTSSETGSADVGVHSAPESTSTFNGVGVVQIGSDVEQTHSAIPSTSDSQVSTTIVPDEESVQIPPPIIQPESGSGDPVGLHFTPESTSTVDGSGILQVDSDLEHTHLASPSDPQASTTAIPPPNISSGSGPGDVDAQSTPESTLAANGSAPVWSKLIWPVLPMLIIPLGVALHLLMRPPPMR